MFKELQERTAEKQALILGVALLPKLIPGNKRPDALLIAIQPGNLTGRVLTDPVRESLIVCNLYLSACSGTDQPELVL